MKIICEVGSNWRTYEHCFEAITKAKACGADIIKFQMFTADELYGPNSSYMTDLSPYELPRRWVPELRAFADKTGIDFMCTAFSVDGYKYVDPFVTRHKVASSEMNHPLVLEYLGWSPKEVLLSTAGAGDEQIGESLKKLNKNNTTIMHCVGQYPARTHQWDKLFHLSSVAFPDYKIGYSDHTLMLWPLDHDEIDYYEKHVTFINDETPDQGHSLTELEFKFFCQSARCAPYNSKEIEDALVNSDMRKLYRRRLVAVEDIPAGSKMELGSNVGIFRPLKPSVNYVPLEKLKEHLEMPLKRDVQRGDTIQLTDLGL